MNTYKNEDLERRLRSDLDHTQAKAKHDAQRMGTQNLPAPQESIIPYWREFHLSYQLILDYLASTLQGESTRYNAITSGQHRADQQRLNQNKIEELNGQLSDTTHKINTAPVHSKAKQSRWAKLATFAICLFESTFNIGVFKSLGLSELTSYIVAFLFGLLLSIYSVMCARCIRWGNTIRKRIALCVLVTLPIVILFTKLGFLRAQYLAQDYYVETGLEAPHISPYPFIIMAVLATVVSIWLNFHYQLTREECNAYNDYCALKQKQSDLTSKIETLTAESKTLAKQSLQERSHTAALFDYGNMWEQFIITTAQSSFANWQKTIRKYRTDGNAPEYVSDYPYSFETRFNLTKHLNNE